MAAGGRPLIAPDPDRRAKVAFGLASAVLVSAFLGGAFAALAFGAGSDGAGIVALLSDPYLRGVVVFTIEQAALSALLSVAGAVPLALALHRTTFPGKGLVLRLLLLPQALSVLVGALGLLAVWGRGGAVSDGLAALGLPRLDIYGLTGILIAHVFFNLPLSTRMMLAALDAVPGESWRLAGQLGMARGAVFRLLEGPAIRTVLPGALGLAFTICVTSFTLVLVLGGGPGATTLEVEIYQALRTDFDPNRAVVLALAQIALTLVFLLAASRLGGRREAAFTPGRPARRFDRGGRGGRLADAAVLVLGLGFVLSPFAAILVRGSRADFGRLILEAAVQRAALQSVAIAFAAAILALLLSLALLFARETLRGPDGRNRADAGSLVELVGNLVLVVPPVVIGAGWFLLLRSWTDVFAFAPALVVAANAVAAMPFALRILATPLAEALARHRRLASQLGLSGLARLRHVEWPALKSPLGLSFALALSLSLGDLGVVALFGNQDFATLPYLLYQRMGSYRTADAAGLALILGTLSLCLVVGAERLFARQDGASA